MMDYQQLLAQRQLLHQKTVADALKENEEQSRMWEQYKKRHEKVIEGLELLPKELSMNCMVPLGKLAMMKGKLCHTNEILVFLGDGYFAKYSAPQAADLCRRRIDRADEMLKGLEKERHLWESREILPFQSDIFGNSSNLAGEYWEEEKLEKWRLEHNERVKKYREKLTQLKSQPKSDITSDEDLFQRLDELELQEELNDELHRLEEERSNFYGEELQSGEVYYESDDESDVSSEEDLTEQIQQELDKLRSFKESLRSISEQSRGEANDVTRQKLLQLSDENRVTETAGDDTKGTTQLETSTSSAKEIANKGLSVDVTLNKNAQDSPPVEKLIKRRVSFGDQQVFKFDTKDSDNDDSEDDVFRIHFTHSDNDANIRQSDDDRVETPLDIYQKFCKPKSILKRSSNDLIMSNVRSIYSTQEEDEHGHEEETTKEESLYQIVVKDIQEKLPSKPVQESSADSGRPVSRFKMERSKQKK